MSNDENGGSNEDGGKRGKTEETAQAEQTDTASSSSSVPPPHKDAESICEGIDGGVPPPQQEVLSKTDAIDTHNSVDESATMMVTNSDDQQSNDTTTTTTTDCIADAATSASEISESTISSCTTTVVESNTTSSTSSSKDSNMQEQIRSDSDSSSVTTTTTTSAVATATMERRVSSSESKEEVPVVIEKDEEVMETTETAAVVTTAVIDTTTTTGSSSSTEQQLASRLAEHLAPSNTASAASATTTAAAAAAASSETVSFKVIFNGKKYDVERPVSTTVRELKEHLAPIIDVSPSMMKVMIKGLAPDTKKLQELGVTRTSKVLVVGSKFDEILKVNTTQSSLLGASGGDSTSDGSSGSFANGSDFAGRTQPLSLQKIHKKIIDKGVPDDAHPAYKNKNKKEPLPAYPISGMVNKLGGKVRLTFKLEHDQVWLGTKQRTEKLNMSSIRTIVSEPITGHTEYCIMGLQLGPTEASRYWLYWVPSQFVQAIKHAILGPDI